MKRCTLFALYLLFSVCVTAQTQQGYVKTKGRMTGSGKVTVGIRIAGVAIKQKSGNAVVSSESGAFTLSIPQKSFYLQAVEKQGYVLSDPDVLAKQYTQSANPLVLVMDDKKQLENDRRAIERKISNSLYAQLEKRSAELEALKEQNKITEEKYQKLVDQLNQDQDDNEHIIKEMAERYLKMDFDVVDEFQRKVSDYILNGRLTEADSLLNSRGDLSSRVAQSLKEGEAIAEAEQTLQTAKTGHQNQQQELARDCYSKYEIFSMQHQNDSATLYIELRARIDTTNAEWQLGAANHLARQNDNQKAEKFYLRALALARQQTGNGPLLATILNNMAILYTQTQRLEVAEEYYAEALVIREQLAKESPEAYRPVVAQTMNNLALLYAQQQQDSESEKYHVRALTIRRQLAAEAPVRYEPDLAVSLNNLASLYLADQAERSEKLYQEALDIYRRLAADDKDAWLPHMAAIQNNLSLLYRQSGETAACRQTFTEALSNYCLLGKTNPAAYRPYVKAMAENIYLTFPGEDERGWQARLNLYRQLADFDFTQYAPSVAQVQNTLADYYDKQNQLQKSEPLYQSALSIYKQLGPTYRSYVARQLGNLSFHYVLTGDFPQAEDYARQGLSTDGTKTYIYSNLGAALLLQGKYAEAEDIYNLYQNSLGSTFAEDLQTCLRLGIVPQEHKEKTQQIIIKLSEK